MPASPAAPAATGSNAPGIDYRPDDPAVLADPFPVYQRLRDEDPAHWSPRLKSWVLTRYADVKRVCQDAAGMSSERLRPFFASLPSPEQERIGAIIRYLSLWMVFRDAPDHTRIRRLASRVFHVKSMHAMRPNVEEITQWLITRIGAREEVDFVADFAGPLPALVIMDMLGVPRADLALIKRLSDEMALFIGSARVAAEKYAVAEAATQEMAAYFRRMIEDRRAHPRADLLSELTHLREEDGDHLSDDELIATCILLLFAGHETTTNHIANGMLSLLAFPGEMQKLRMRPDLAAAAVEELLRYDGPSGAQVRVVREAHTLHGRKMKPGERVFIMLNAANRDERAYANPDLLDIERDGVAHLTFGYGNHICLGFPLARLEGQVVFPALLAAFGHIERAPGALEWLRSPVFRGVTALPLRVARR
ncbi:MAG TPA: cytochrome P450 [Burkholderiales bacterium]